MACCMIGLAMLMGMAKPMPCAPPATAVLMPMTSPVRVDQRAAGVAGIDGGVRLDEVAQRPWLARAAGVIDHDVATEGADDAAGDAVVKVPRGLPMASASWPGLSAAESPMRRPAGPGRSIWTMARSVRVSMP